MQSCFARGLTTARELRCSSLDELGPGYEYRARWAPGKSRGVTTARRRIRCAFVRGQTRRWMTVSAVSGNVEFTQKRRLTSYA